MSGTVSVGTLSYGYPTISKYIAALKAEFMYGGYLTALASLMLIMCTWTLMDRPISLPVLLIAYLMPLIVYGYDYYKEMDADAASNPERALVIGNKARIYPVILAVETFILAYMLAVFGNTWLTLFCFFVLLNGFAYTIVIKSLTRVIPGFKSVYTSMIWGACGAFIPLLQYSMGLSLFFILAFAFFTMKAFINVIFFDIKDIETDRERGLKTIPVLLGRDGTIKFLYAINLLSVVPIIIGVYTGAMPLFAIALCGIIFHAYYFLSKGTKSDAAGIRRVSYTLAESETIFYLLLLLAGKAVFTLA